MHCRHFWSDNQINAYAEQVAIAGRQQPLVDLPEVSGCAFFVRKDIWEQMEGFDRNLRDYGNESELCTRLLTHGWRVVWTRASYIHHFGRQTYSRIWEENHILDRAHAARLYMNQKHNVV